MSEQNTLKPLPYGSQWIDEDDVAAVAEAVQADYLTQGPGVRAFEASLAQKVGARYAVACNSGTAALHMAAGAFHRDQHGVSIVAAVTFLSSANAVAFFGDEVVFADVEPDTALIDPESLARAVETAQKAGKQVNSIIAVDMCGQPVDIAAIRDIAASCGAGVIQDAAHSLGGRYQLDGEWHRVGSCAGVDAATFSFHPIKHITTGEGGAVMTNDERIREVSEAIRCHGMHKDSARFVRDPDSPWVGPWYYEQDSLGYNYRITDLQCALGVSQLAKLDAFVARRREIAAYYDQRFQSELADVVAPLKQYPDRENAYHLYVIRVLPRPGDDDEAVAERRKSLYSWLRDHKIYAQVNYIPVPWQPFWAKRSRTSPEHFPGARAYYASCLSLPMFPRLEDADLDRVVDTIAAWHQNQ